MIEVKDRIPTYPGRVKLIPVAGQANTYDLVRADEPIEAGTPINRALFQSLLADIDAIRQQVDDKIFELSQRVRIGDLTVGSVFGLYENGVLVPFIKLANQYENNTGVLVIRKNCVTTATLTDAGEYHYANCKTDRWLNNVYITRLDQATQSVIPDTAFQTLSANGIGKTTRKVVLPSLTEYQMISYYGIPSEGESISYFSTAARRIAMLNGTPTNHWTRSLDGLSDNAAYITTNGGHEIGSPGNMVAGIRPMFTLPAYFEVTAGEPSQENVMATAEVL